ncbi:hypothetical protein C2L66_34505 [Paraburkholderia caribensis]|nr:hypothetical protein C2L66_34505 [Paraburkholderia caribensis]
MREASCRVPKRVLGGVKWARRPGAVRRVDCMRHSRRVTRLRAACVWRAHMNLSSRLNRDRAKIAGSSSF